MLDVKDLIGIPYKEHGRNKKEGFDCYGLAIEIYKRMGKHLDDVIYEDHDLELCKTYKPLLKLKAIDQVKEGVLLEIALKGELHIGVCLDSRSFIHSTIDMGVRISQIKEYQKRNLIKGMYIWD